MMKKTMYWILTVVMVMQSTSPLGWIPMLETRVEATYLQNDNAGAFELTFPNSEGILSRVGMTLTGGVAFLSEGALTGKLQTIAIEPASMRYWDHLSLTTTMPSETEIFVSLIDCDSELPIAGWEHLPYP
ncbi:MAG: hypothetical protein LBG52_09080 [Candidatus Peribacteria bacterium]|jgi:hypothetical protein|nr:hypothetical protein [Candidatus Peribacteria bacterium]